MESKLDYMYDYLDFDHDRAKVRDKFLKEMNKKTSLEDIGETLDKLVIESKAANWQYYDITSDWMKQPERPSQDFSSADFSWSSKLLKDMDPKTPLFIEDPKQIN